MLITAREHQDLSMREKQILTLLARGYNQVQVADRVFLSPHTINFHVRNIMKKLAAANITAAVAKAITEHKITINRMQ